MKKDRDKEELLPIEAKKEMEVGKSIVSLSELQIDDHHPTREIAEYCLPLIEIMFHGQTTHGDDVRDLYFGTLKY